MFDIKHLLKLGQNCRVLVLVSNCISLHPNMQKRKVLSDSSWFINEV